MPRLFEQPLRSRYVARWVLLGLLAGCGPSPRLSAPPNVVLVSIDTLRADRLNAYGYAARVTSPAIDALAADGILFERCSAASPWTTPAHASLFTGRFPSAHGLTQSLATIRRRLGEGESFNRLASSQTTLAEVLAQAGYATAAFTGGVTLDPVLGFDQGFDRYETSMFKLDRRNMGELEAWLDEVAEVPFFLFWHTFEVHTPFLDSRFLDEVLEPGRASALAALIEQLAARFRRRTDDFGVGTDLHVEMQRASLAQAGVLTREVSDALYCGGIASVDQWLGELVALLRDRKLYERTLFVLTSDHGEELGEHDERMFYHSHGHHVYEELVHVPLIVKLPGGAHAGRRVAAIASAVDVMPTVLDVFSLEGVPPGMQGVTLRPFWEGQAEQALRPVTIESLVVEHEKKAIREGDFKYILSIPAREVKRHGRRRIPERVGRELYDLGSDPLERNNLLAGEVEPRHRRIARELEAKLRASVASGDGIVESIRVDEELLEGLEALGYLGDDGGADEREER